jgi:hypothetical protein
MIDLTKEDLLMPCKAMATSTNICYVILMIMIFRPSIALDPARSYLSWYTKTYVALQRSRCYLPKLSLRILFLMGLMTHEPYSHSWPKLWDDEVFFFCHGYGSGDQFGIMSQSMFWATNLIVHCRYVTYVNQWCMLVWRGIISCNHEYDCFFGQLKWWGR